MSGQDRPAAPGARGDAGRSFDRALERARGANGPGSPDAPRLAGAGAPRRGVAHRAGADAPEREGPGAAASSLPPDARRGGPCAAIALPELREAARAVPAAVWAGQVAGGPAVELSFGRDLAIELRRAPGGLELSIRAAPSLARAARVDLPALLRTLRGRGIEVIRAEVREVVPARPGR